MTKISANGSSDINMLLASPPAAAWAYAGVISIQQSSSNGKEPAMPDYQDLGIWPVRANSRGL
jgi:hypothetical protein